MRRVYGDDDIRDLVMSMEHPTIATRGTLVVAINDSYARTRGVARGDIEGKSIVPFLAPEERERLTQRIKLPDNEVSFERPLRTISKSASGQVLPILTFTSRFHAAEPPDYRLTHVYADTGEGGELTFARELLGISAELIGARTEDEVRNRTRAAFEGAGLTARFVSAGAEGDLDKTAIEAAVREKRPIFAGPSNAPGAVYVPFDANEVLYIAGEGLSGQHAYAFGFFAKLISTALLDLRASQAARRQLSDTQLLLQLARTTSETLDLDAVMGTTAESLVKLLDVSSCFILLYDERADALRGRASSSTRRGVVTDIAIPLVDERSVAAAAARSREPIVIPDTKTDPRALRSALVSAFEEAALVAIPILTRGRLEGVVVLDDTRGARNFNKEWIDLATAMVAQVGLSIANARLYESLRRSYEELEATRAEMVKRERLAGLGELAAIVAHEVRNPVGVIYNASASLKRLVETSDDGATLVGIVREECERLNQIVGDLLDFARPRQLSLSPEEVPRLLGDVLDALGDTQQVKVEVRTAENLPLLEVDRRLMRQALVNVALNGVQSMPQGGRLHLYAFAPDEDRAVVIEVTDEGSGIPPAHLTRIFEPFFTTKATGSGLGLAVVKRIVEDHGGQVTVASSPEGTTFRFRLPRARANDGV